MGGGLLARIDGGADVLGGGDILHGVEGMDRGVAGRTRRVRFLLHGHVEVRRTGRMNGEGGRRTWTGMRRAHRASVKREREMKQGEWPVQYNSNQRQIGGWMVTAWRSRRGEGRMKMTKRRENSRDI